MTKEELNQLNNIRAEIREIERKLEQLRGRKIGTASDKVKASYKDFPYIEGSVKIDGFDETAYERKQTAIENKIELLERRIEQARKKEIEITEYINSVNDSRVRRAMEYRYIDGYKWNKIARLMNCDRTYPEKIIRRYLENEV